jgi:hypothetical protein
VDEDIVCDVCRSDEYDGCDPEAPVGSDERIGDAIVICDKCNSGVHQRCYGRELLNPNGLQEGDWYCTRCNYLRNSPSNHPTEVCCDLCNDLKGIIVDYKNKTTNRQGWAHICCINWSSDLWFLDDNTIEVEGELSLPRYQLHCYICRQKKGTGCLI